MQTKKVFKLDDEMPQTPFRLIGIAATIKYFTFCHHLNTLLEVDFQAAEPVEIVNAKAQKISFQALFANSEVGDIQFSVFVNKEAGQFLLPEAANYDFILKISGDSADEIVKQTCKQIKSIKGVLIAAEIPLNKIKHSDRLIVAE